MREQVQARLELLRREHDSAEVRLRDLERQRAQVGETMLRLNGAIAVLEELLIQAPSSNGQQIDAALEEQAIGALRTSETKTATTATA